MSQENVQKIRAAYEQFNRTHEPDRNLLHPAIKWHTAPDLPDSGTHRGHDGVARLFSEWAASLTPAARETMKPIDKLALTMARHAPGLPRLGLRLSRRAGGAGAYK
jgi:hypothetical protein